MRKKIAFIFEEDYLGAYPSFVECIIYLSQNNYIDVIGTSRKTNFPEPPKFNKNVRFYKLQINDEISRDYSNRNILNLEQKDIKIKHPASIIKSIIPNNIKSFIRNKINFLKYNISNLDEQKKLFFNHMRYIIFVFKKLLKTNYDAVICIDLYGGSAAYISSLLIPPKKFIYWGLEITTLEQSLFVKIIIKFFETKACQSSDIILTTDEVRAKDICNDNNTSFINNNFIFIPHSPTGFCLIKKSSFFQNLFSIDENITTILHCGWIHDVMLSKELALASRAWPENYKLIFHERMKRDLTEPYIQEVIKASAGKVLLSLDPVDYHRIDEVVLSSKIGIVIYDTHKNWGTSWISLAKGSGKIAHYLKCGKPIICVNLPGFVEIVDKYKCGLIFKDLSEIHSGITKILKNYSYYSTNAIHCYKEQYECSKHFAEFSEYLNH